MILTADRHVMLARRITEERMIALEPPFEAPDWSHWLNAYSFVPNAFVMAADGVVARWCPADEIVWSTAVAVRFEAPWGDAIDPRDLEDTGDLDWGDYE